MFNKKILIIGPEIADTDLAVSKLANENNTVNHGLIERTDLDKDIKVGYYHSTIVDISPGDVAHIATKFDSIELSQHLKSEYPHFKSFVNTVNLLLILEEKGIPVKYDHNPSAKHLVYWKKLLNENKSICFYPFMGLLNANDGAQLCPKQNKTIRGAKTIADWKTNPEFNYVRTKMLAGEQMPEYCHNCYLREEEGQESTRQHETLEWVEKLNFSSIEDFTKLEAPAYYEIRPGNMCNILCRTCDNVRSHLIEREWKQIGIPLVNETQVIIPIENIDFNHAKRIYYAGGEPTVTPEFYNFLEHCIKNNTTDFELTIGTNGMKYSDKLLNLLDHFPNVCFSTSFDGYKKVNDYIRWGSDFDTILRNTHKVVARGHTVSLQTVISTYSVSRIHEIFEFWDREFPTSGALIQVGDGQGDIFLPNNHPCPEIVVESMRRCQQTNVYHTFGRSVKSQIDLMLDYYSNPNYTVNLELLKNFYDFNDKLDQSRGSKLGDYIPELEEARKKYFG